MSSARLQPGDWARVPELAAASHPDRELVTDRPSDLFETPARRMTYQTFAAETEKIAAKLVVAGVMSGDTVVISKRDHLDVLAAVFAVMRVSATPALIAQAMDPRIRAQLVRRLRPRLALVDNDVDFLEQIAGGPTVVYTGDRVAEASRLRHWRDLDAGIVGVPGPRDVPKAVITHTSGTTGVPKLVRHDPAVLWHQMKLQLGPFRLLGPRQRVLACARTAHSRVLTGVTAALLTGWDLCLFADPSPAMAAQMMHAVQPTVVETYPNVYLLWEAAGVLTPQTVGRTRLFFSTYDAVHPRTIRATLRASERRSAVYVQGYGQTETGPVTARLYTKATIPRRGRSSRCVGWPVPGDSRVSIAPPAGGRDVGTAGEILVMMRAGTSAYLDGEIATSVWPMGDIGYLSRLKCLHIVDRAVDQSSRVPSLLALEDILLERLPQAADVVLIRTGSTTVTPVVCTADGMPLPDGVWSEVTKDLPALGPPVVMPWSEVARTATFKVRRHVLAAELEGDPHGSLAGSVSHHA